MNSCATHAADLYFTAPLNPCVQRLEEGKRQKEKAKYVADVWGTEFIQFLTALAIGRF